MVRRRKRTQKGQLYERAGTIYVRVYQTEIIDGRATRVQRSHRLGSTEDFPGWRRNRDLKNAQTAFMLAFNENSGRAEKPKAIEITSYWTSTYLPHLKAIRRPSTVSGYEDLYEKWLEPHFRGRTFVDYRPSDGTIFLESLTSDLGRRSIAHCRALASGLFKYAVGRGVNGMIRNPWREVSSPETAAPKATEHYTLEEAENIVSALVERVDAQLVVALACFMGLRTGEIAGLEWGDFDEGWLHIRRAFVRGEVGPTKTPESTASIPLIPQVLVPLELWRQKCGGPTTGWVFMNQVGRPMDMREMQRRVIRPIVEKAGLQWKELRAGRRGAATALVALHGPLAAQQLLRHKNMSTTLAHYQKPVRDALIAGMKLLGEQKSGGDQ